MNDTPRDNPEAIRSDIDVTRRRMDDTMDALGERLQPRHLLDEFLGFFRRSTEGDGKLTHMKETVTHSVDTAMHSVIDTVKKNPMPALLIGAGVAWMIYDRRRDKSPRSGEPYPIGDTGREGVRYDPDVHYDRPLEYATEGDIPSRETEWTEWSDQGGSKLGELKHKVGEKAQETAENVKEKLSHAGDIAREKTQHLRETAGDKLHAVRERASDLGHRVGERTRAAYARTRERVATTADQHPFETGLACLAAGVIAGLALPTPEAVNRRVGPAAGRLRARTREAGREMLDKGRHVAEAAMHAAQDEARAQGLTPESTRTQPEGNQSGSEVNDPTLARPSM